MPVWPNFYDKGVCSRILVGGLPQSLTHSNRAYYSRYRIAPLQRLAHHAMCLQKLWALESAQEQPAIHKNHKHKFNNHQSNRCWRKTNTVGLSSNTSPRRSYNRREVKVAAVSNPGGTSVVNGTQAVVNTVSTDGLDKVPCYSMRQASGIEHQNVYWSPHNYVQSSFRTPGKTWTLNREVNRHPTGPSTEIRVLPRRTIGWRPRRRSCRKLHTSRVQKGSLHSMPRGKIEPKEVECTQL